MRYLTAALHIKHGKYRKKGDITQQDIA